MAKKSIQKPAEKPQAVADETAKPAVNETETSQAEAPKAPEAKRTQADVVVGKNVVRTYTLAENGEDFADLAASYASKVGGTVR